MTIKELKLLIKDLPDIMDVGITQIHDDFGISIELHASVKDVEFREDSGPLRAKDKVFVITDAI